MPLSKTFTGPLSDTFALMGRLCFSMTLAPEVNSGSTNEFMQMLKGHTVKVTIEEVPAHV